MYRFLFILVVALVSSVFAVEVDLTSAGKSGALPQFKSGDVKTQNNSFGQTPLYLEETIDSSYVIGPGDFFEIVYPKGVDDVQVSPEGSVSVPGCGIVKVDSLTLAQAKRVIMDALLTRYEEKYIQVQIVGVKKIYVSVLGAIKQPGFRAVEPQTRLSTMLGYVGNLLPLADKKNMKMIRGKDTVTLDFLKYENEGVDSINIRLQNNDIVYIPYMTSEQTLSISSLNATETVPHVQGRTFGEYLDNLKTVVVGGNKWIKVEYPDGNITTYELAKARDLVFDPKTKVELWSKDPLVYVGGAVAVVGRSLYNPSYHAIDYIAASGVTIITGSWSRVTRIRDGQSSSIDPFKDEILPGDYIEIPRSIYESIKDVTLFLASLLSVVATAIIISQY